MIGAAAFFATARERYSMMLRRRRGLPAPWTEDPIFRAWRFCNVHREDDRATTWLRQNVRRPLIGADMLDRLVFSTVAFRWFNRPEVGELLLPILVDSYWEREYAYGVLKDVRPVVTGAFIVHTPYGMPKLEGALTCVDLSLEMLPEMMEGWRSRRPNTLEDTWTDLLGIPNVGGFMSYEIVSDLRWTPWLADAPDIHTWANAGPGCARGLGRVVAGDPDLFTTSRRDQAEMLRVMRELLSLSQIAMYWPQEWNRWEMREVEHWACEFDKYQRAEAGERLKRRYP